MKRRTFISRVALGATAIAASPLVSCSTGAKNLKISLAQWSLHRAFFEGKLDAADFAAIAMDTYGIDAIEYVNGFYMDSARDEKFWSNMKDRAAKAGVKSLLMMVDDEGDLGAAIIDGMGRLAEYAAQSDINIVIENHGLYSSDAQLIASIIKEVNLPNFGSFPDFGNWCLSAKWGTTQGDCDRVYDRYQGVSELLPYAKAVSAKSYNFNEQGEDTKIDYYRMLEIVKRSDYDGYIGIEYEGEVLGEHEGILTTKALMEKAWNSIP